MAQGAAPTVGLSAADINALSAIAAFEAGNQGAIGMAAVIDTIINRSVSPSFPTTVFGVITQPRQFTALTGPQRSRPAITHGLQSVQDRLNAMIAATPRNVRDLVSRHVASRVHGMPSVVGRAVNYARADLVGVDRANQGWVQGLNARAERGAPDHIQIGAHVFGTVPGATPAPEISTIRPDLSAQRALEAIGAPPIPQPRPDRPEDARAVARDILGREMQLAPEAPASPAEAAIEQLAPQTALGLRPEGPLGMSRASLETALGLREPNPSLGFAQQLGGVGRGFDPALDATMAHIGPDVDTLDSIDLAEAVGIGFGPNAVNPSGFGPVSGPGTARSPESFAFGRTAEDRTATPERSLPSQSFEFGRTAEARTATPPASVTLGPGTAQGRSTPNADAIGQAGLAFAEPLGLGRGEAAGSGVPNTDAIAQAGLAFAEPVSISPGLAEGRGGTSVTADPLAGLTERGKLGGAQGAARGGVSVDAPATGTLSMAAPLGLESMGVKALGLSPSALASTSLSTPVDARIDQAFADTLSPQASARIGQAFSDVEAPASPFDVSTPAGRAGAFGVPEAPSLGSGRATALGLSPNATAQAALGLAEPASIAGAEAMGWAGPTAAADAQAALSPVGPVSNAAAKGDFQGWTDPAPSSFGPFDSPAFDQVSVSERMADPVGPAIEDVPEAVPGMTPAARISQAFETAPEMTPADRIAQAMDVAKTVQQITNPDRAMAAQAAVDPTPETIPATPAPVAAPPEPISVPQAVVAPTPAAPAGPAAPPAALPAVPPSAMSPAGFNVGTPGGGVGFSPTGIHSVDVGMGAHSAALGGGASQQAANYAGWDAFEASAPGGWAQDFAISQMSHEMGKANFGSTGQNDALGLSQDQAGGGSSESSKVLCTYFTEMGWLPTKLRRAEHVWTMRNFSEWERAAYRRWARPLIRMMDAHPWLRKPVFKLLTEPWVNETAYRLNKTGKTTPYSRFVVRVYPVLNRAIGRLFSDEALADEWWQPV